MNSKVEVASRGGFTYGFTGAPTNDLPGNGGQRRVTLVCDPNLPKSERTFDRQFRTECIRPGGGADDPYYLGKSTNDEYHPPGYINHDMTFFKNFAIGTRTLQASDCDGASGASLRHEGHQEPSCRGDRRRRRDVCGVRRATVCGCAYRHS